MEKVLLAATPLPQEALLLFECWDVCSFIYRGTKTSYTLMLCYLYMQVHPLLLTPIFLLCRKDRLPPLYLCCASEHGIYGKSLWAYTMRAKTFRNKQKCLNPLKRMLKDEKQTNKQTNTTTNKRKQQKSQLWSASSSQLHLLFWKYFGAKPLSTRLSSLSRLGSTHLRPLSSARGRTDLLCICSSNRLTQTTHVWCLRGNLDDLGSLGTTPTWRPG